METTGEGFGPVKGMIRNRETGQYYKGDGQWTSDSNEAIQFDQLSKVVTEAQRYGLEGTCEFVVELDGQIGFRVLLPL